MGVQTKIIALFGIILILFLAVIIFFDPVMSSETEPYLPDYIDTTFIIYAFVFAIIILFVYAVFSG